MTGFGEPRPTAVMCSSRFRAIMRISGRTEMGQALVAHLVKWAARADPDSLYHRSNPFWRMGAMPDVSRAAAGRRAGLR